MRYNFILLFPSNQRGNDLVKAWQVAYGNACNRFDSVLRNWTHRHAVSYHTNFMAVFIGIEGERIRDDAWDFGLPNTYESWGFGGAENHLDYRDGAWTGAMNDHFIRLTSMLSRVTMRSDGSMIDPRQPFMPLDCDDKPRRLALNEMYSRPLPLP